MLHCEFYEIFLNIYSVHLWTTTSKKERLIQSYSFRQFLENIYLFKANNRNTRKRCEICSKWTIKLPEQRHWRRSGVFIINFEHISHLLLVFLLLNLNK